MVISFLKSKFSKIRRDESGNFMMFAAVLTPVLVMSGALAVDFTNVMSMKTHVQDAADGAALATSSQLSSGKITKDQAVLYATQFFDASTSESAKLYSDFSAVPTVTVTSEGTGKKIVWKVQVTAIAEQRTTGMARLMGKDKVDVNVLAYAQSGKDATNPLSMMLVLDRSGSMTWASGRTTTETVPRYCYSRRSYYECGTTTQTVDIPKMEILKEAVEKLVSHIEESDDTNEYARIGAVAYNYRTTNSDKLSASWDKSKVTDFTNSLVAENGTYAVDAMQWAYEQVTGSGEINAHFSKNGSKSPSKFIVFMTDGKHDTGSPWQNNYADKKTKEYCDEAKAEGVTIFSVGFQAPEQGKELLQACASGDQYYYDAQSADALTEAFTAIGEEAVKTITRLTM